MIMIETVNAIKRQLETETDEICRAILTIALEDELKILQKN